jgi:hypothetical protein
LSNRPVKSIVLIGRSLAAPGLSGNAADGYHTGRSAIIELRRQK